MQTLLGHQASTNGRVIYMSLASMNTQRRATYPPARPVEKAVPVVAAASLLVLAPIWQPDVLLHALMPLGFFDTSLALWVTVFATPLIILLSISGIPVLRARKRHVGDFAGLDDSLGTRLSTLAGASLVVEYIATFALASAMVAFLIGAAWPAYTGIRTPVAVVVAMLIAMGQTIGVRKRAPIAAVAVILGFVLIIFLTAGLIGSSPFFSTTGSSDLAIVSREVASRSPSSLRIVTAILAGLTVALVPALLLRHISTDLSNFKRPRPKNAGATQVVFAIVGSLLAIIVLGNVADVDAGRYLPRRYVLYSALRVIGTPQWLLAATSIILIGVAIAAARTVLNDASKLSGELANFHLLPNQLVNEAVRSSVNPLLYAFAASILIIIGKAEIRFIIPILVISGFISLTLTRWSTMRFWTNRLRTEGHSRERITMKRARLMALIGLIICIIVLAAFFLGDITRGAWIAAIAIAVLYVLLYAVRRHYLIYGTGAGEKTTKDPIVPGRVHYMILAQTLGPVLTRATRWIQSTRPYSIELIHVDRGGNDVQDALEKWRETGLDVDLTILETAKGRPTQVVIDHVRRTRAAHPNRLVNVVLPQVVFANPLQSRLHNNELDHLEKSLKKEPGVLVTIIPWVE